MRRDAQTHPRPTPATPRPAVRAVSVDPDPLSLATHLSAGPAAGRSAGLDDQLCFALYAATNAIVRAYRPLLQAVGLTYPQYVVLMALWEEDDISVSDLSARVRMPLSGLGPILDRLVEADLVERSRHLRDRRVVRLSLTDRGRLMEERAVVAQQEVRCQTRLSTDEVEQLRGSLQNLTSTLDDHGSGAPGVDDAS